MISDVTRNEFVVRYYKWCLADAMREFEHGFPLLKTIKDYGVMGELDYLEQLGIHDRLLTLKATVGHCHHQALELLNDTLSAREQELLAEYFDKSMPFVGKYIDQYYSSRVSPDRLKRVNKNRLAKLVRLSLEPICGKIVQRDSSRLWTHLTTCEGWEIYTEVDMGGHFDLSYSHSILEPGTTTDLKNIISFNRWLGLGETQWSMLTEADESEAAKSISGLCAHFLQAAPALLRGLSQV